MEEKKVVISFITEDDKMNGIAELYRTNIGFSGIGQNQFIVEDIHIQALKRNDIKFEIKDIKRTYKDINNIVNEIK